MNKKKLIKIAIAIAIIGGVFLLTLIKEKETNVYSDFTKYYFQLITKANLQKIDEATHEIRLFNKIGFFYKNTCMKNLGQKEIKRIIKEIKPEVEGMLKLTAKEKQALFSLKMNEACLSFGAFSQFDLYFNKISILKIEDADDGIKKVTINVFSKLLNKSLKMIALINTNDKKLKMQDIQFFPKATYFLKNNNSK